MNIEMERKNIYNFPCIDLFKFISAIMILLIHANPFGNNVYGVVLREIITPIAVPFFFLASGFLWYISYQNYGKKKAKSKIFHTLFLYFIWSIIYLPFVFINLLFSNNLNFNMVLNYIKNFLFEGSFETIWFLNALWSALALIYILLKKFNIKKIFIISIPFYLISILLSSWNDFFVSFTFGKAITNLYYSFFETTKNGLLFGFFFVSMGALLATSYMKKRENLNRLPLLKNDFFNKEKYELFIYSFFCLFLIIFEWFIRTCFFGDGKSCDITFALIPTTYLLGYISIYSNIKNKNIYYKLRKYSTLIFLLQRIPITIFNYIDIIYKKNYGNYILKLFPSINFILISVFTFLCAFIFIKLSKKFTIIKKLY